MYFTRQSLILPGVQPLGPGMGGQGFETPCMIRLLSTKFESFDLGFEKFEVVLLEIGE